MKEEQQRRRDHRAHRTDMQDGIESHAARPLSRWVAKEWRNVCGLIQLRRGSRAAHPLSALKKPWRVIARPSRLVKRAELGFTGAAARDRRLAGFPFASTWASLCRAAR